MYKIEFDLESNCFSGDEKAEASDSDFANTGLKAHNMLRKIHEAPEMKLNSEMNKMAEEYAKKLAKAGNMKHSSKEERKGDGENLAYSCQSKEDYKMGAEEATKNW